MTTVYVDSVKPDDEIRQLLEIDLESAKEKLAILGTQVKQYQESVSTVEADLSSPKVCTGYLLSKVQVLAKIYFIF